MSTSIDLRIELSGIVEITLDESDIAEIAMEYNGDYKSYIENIEFARHHIDWDEDDRFYSKKAIKEELEKYKKEHNLAEDFKIKYSKAKENFLKKHQVDFSQYFSIIDRRLPSFLETSDELKLLTDSADYNNPKHELNDIYFDKDFVVSTNTKKMAIVKNDTDIKDIYIPKVFLEYYIHKDAELEIVDDDVLLHHEGYHYHYCPTHGRRFPEYQRVIPKEDTKHIISYDQFLKDSIVVQPEEEEYYCELRAIKIEDKIFTLSNENIPDLTFDTFHINKPDLPMMFKKQDTTYLVMPIVLSDDKDEHLISKIEKLLEHKE